MRHTMLGAAVALALAVAAQGASAQGRAHRDDDNDHDRARAGQYGQYGQYGQHGGRGAVDSRLDDYLQGISLTGPERVRVDRAWNSGGTLDQRLDAVRTQLSGSQRQRFDANRARIEQGYGGYGTYGGYPSDGGYGSYPSNGRGRGQYGASAEHRQDGAHRRWTKEEQREWKQRKEAQKREWKAEKQARKHQWKQSRGQDREDDRHDDHDRG